MTLTISKRIALLFLALIATACTDDPTETNTPLVDDGKNPLVTVQSFTTSNPNDANKANPGEVMTVVFIATEPLATPTVVIGGKTATAVVNTTQTGGSETWQATRTLDNIETAGRITFAITYEDRFGNAGDAKDHTDIAKIINFIPPEWVLAWQEQFGGVDNNGSKVLDTSIWNYQYGDGCAINLCGWGNGESQHYREENASIVSLDSDSGSEDQSYLQIEVRKETINGASQYTSARINTAGKFEVLYGRVQVRAQLPGGAAVWPAAWMLPEEEIYGYWPNSGEIDILETQSLGVDGENTLSGTLHYKNRFNKQQAGGNTVPDSALNAGFHIYEVRWYADKFEFYFDDELYYTVNSNNWNTEQLTAPFDQSFHLLLNVALGGAFTKVDIDDADLPSQFLVDYIKVYCPTDAATGNMVNCIDSPNKRTGLPITFEAADSSAAVYDIGNNISVIAPDPVNSNNLVIRTLDNTFSQSGVSLLALGGEVIPFVEGKENNIAVQVYSPEVGIPITLKVSAGSVSREVTVNSTVANQWETLIFAFRSQVDPSAYNFNAIDIFFNYGMNNGEKVFYWDNVTFDAGDDYAADFDGNIFVEYIPENISLAVSENTNGSATMIEMNVTDAGYSDVIVIDSDTANNATFNFQFAEVANFSELTNHILSFDIFVVSHPTDVAAAYLLRLESENTATDCNDGCSAGTPYQYATQADLTVNQWHNMTVNLAELQSDDLDLGRIKNLVFYNSTGLSAAANYYLDNIRIGLTSTQIDTIYDNQLTGADLGAITLNVSDQDNAGATVTNQSQVDSMHTLYLDIRSDTNQAVAWGDPSTVLDLTSYANGKLTFGFYAVTHPTNANANYIVKFESPPNNGGDDNRGKDVIFATQAETTVGQWQDISVDISELITTTMNSSTNINRVAFLNTWDQAAGGRFYIDNIQITAPGQDDIALLTPENPSLTPGVYSVPASDGTTITIVDNIDNALNFDFAASNQSVGWLEWSSAVDFSDYSTLTFDIKITQKPTDPTSDYRVKVESATTCDNCTEWVFANYNDYTVDTWYTVNVPIASLDHANNDLAAITKLVLFNAWGKSSSSSFVIDNIRLSNESLQFNAVPPEPISGAELVVFDDAVGSTWNSGINGFDEAIEYNACSGTGAGCPNLSWSIIDATDTARGKVLQITHAVSDQFSGLFIGSSAAVDLSNYANGKVQFDILVTNLNSNSGEFDIKFDCGSGCKTTDQSIGTIPANAWRSIAVDMQTLIAAGLDVSKVTNGFVIFPKDEQQSGMVYQLDNIRWTSE